MISRKRKEKIMKIQNKEEFKKELSNTIIKKIEKGRIIASYYEILFNRTIYIYSNDKEFKIRDLKIIDVKIILPKFNNLNKLGITSSNLIEIPIEIFQLKQIKILDLQLNKINNIPADISQLTNLKILILQYNKLNNIDNLCGLSNLILLNLNHNNLKKISDEIYNLKNLIQLNISHNKLLNINNLKFNKFSYLKNLEISKIKFKYKIFKNIYFDELIIDSDEESNDWDCLDLSDINSIIRYRNLDFLDIFIIQKIKNVINNNINIKMYIGPNNKKQFDYSNNYILKYKKTFNNKIIKKFIIIYNMARLIHYYKLN